MNKTPTETAPAGKSLHDPDADAIRDAFAALPRCGELHIQCPWDHRLAALRTLGECGAFAIRADPGPGFDRIHITALKGKSGPCYETGRSATYLGAAAAVMDDDRHLIAGTLRVCEKTGGLYQLTPYSGLLSVTAADAALLRRLDSDPVPFDCNTFETDAGRIAASLAPGGTAAAADAGVYYPGPFSLLVLRDGSIVRRGQPVRIATTLVSDLCVRDGLLRLPAHRAGEAPRASNYGERHAAEGAGCLIEGLCPAAPASATTPRACIDDAAWDALRDAPARLLARLRRVVSDREPYFILTGSDPRDACGCCPSTDVGAANRLVEAGLLASHRIPAPADACTTTVYAFAGELDASGDPPRFSVCDQLRLRAAGHLLQIQGNT